MRFLSAAVLGLAVGVAPAAFAQAPKPAEQSKKGERAGKGEQAKKSEEDFVKEKPTVGDALPDVTVYGPDGKEVKTSDLRGHHTVLVFGCLT